ncbi:MAG: histidine kinase dimerization/phospho-acceptor domain-containing protein, partial [Cellulosilyticaceae bacterium]
MVIWFKKITRNTITKSVAIMLLVVMAVVGFSSLANLAESRRYGIAATSYEETYQFREKYLIPLASYARDWIVRYDDENIFDEELVNIEEYKVIYEQEIQEIQNNKDETKIIDEMTLLEERIRKEVIRDRKEYFEKIQQALVYKPINFEYLAINVTDNKVITNIENYDDNNRMQYIEELENRIIYAEGDGEDVYITNNDGYKEYWGGRYYDNESLIKQNIAKTYQIIVAPRDTFVVQDKYAKDKELFITYSEQYNDNLLKGMISLVVGIVLMAYLTIVAGRKPYDDELHLKKMDAINFEVYAVIALVLFILGGAVFITFANTILGNNLYTAKLYNAIILLCIMVAISLILLSIYLIFVRLIKGKCFWKNTIIGRFGRWIIKMYSETEHIEASIIVIFGIYLLINAIIAFIFFGGWGILRFLMFGAAIIFNGIALILIVKIISDIKKISYAIQKIEQGDLDYQITLVQTLPILIKISKDINSIGLGLKKAVDKALKSEKMKAELITNVSHDLKTPLTSIISYIDLMKGETIENERVNEYIEVISERGERLKTLIQDLVEVSKASTGNMQVNLETVELGQFIQQAIGEYTDRFEEKELTVVMNVEEVYVKADRHHMWRIIDNLFSNV